MAKSIPLTPGVVESLLGDEIARIISIAFFALFVYEWMITLDEEVKHFWSGSWTLTRVLFLLNRYIPIPIMLLGLACFSVVNPTDEFCRPAIGAGWISNIAGMGLIQAIITLRVWYVFTDSKIMQWTAVAAFVVTNLFSLYFAALAAFEIHVFQQPFDIVGCGAFKPKMFWRMFFPSLLLHTFLYILTAVRALRNRRILKHAPVLKRLLRDGGFFFLIVFVTVGFTAIGSFLDQQRTLSVAIVFSNYLLAINSIAVSRVILSIQDLASNLGSDAAWLLNNAELSRVGWRKGSTDGEIIVERWASEVDDDEESKLALPSSASSIGGRNSPFKVTRVGVYNESSW